MPRNRKYHWLRDEYQLYVKGYEKYYATYQDASKFFIQLRDAHAYFSVLKRDVEKNFVIEHPDKKIAALLNEYFVQNRYRMNRGRLFSNAHNLIDFFANSYQQTAIIGEMFYYIDWQTKELDGVKYRIPDSFDFIHPETMSCKKDSQGNIVGFKQRYSLYAKIKERKDERKFETLNFKPWEIFYTRYPFGKTHPVKKSYKLIRHFMWFMKYMLWSGEAGAYSKPRALAVERARDKRFEDEKRKHYLLTARAYKNFSTPIPVNDINITRYYDFFYYSRFKSEIYRARQYYVDAFNEQVLKPFATKNKLSEVPILKMFDLITDEQLLDYFEKWKKGIISKDEFLAIAVKPD
ncbi:hypothetical protein KBB49_02185 [Candidatus Saccharibacteria bacterium]|nr:hypothetical protein [Candidatus Saccharibacteria bacterium]